MAFESTSSQQSQQLVPSSKVNLKCEEGIIAFNNTIALLEHPNELYQPMLSFLSNCCINKAFTVQPSVVYMEYLQEFWYTTEVEEKTKTITFLLLWCDEPLSFTQKEFIFAIGLPMCKDPVPLPPKESVRVGLATLAKLFQEPKQSLIPPSREGNANDTTDKSLSRTFVQHVTQSKAPTDLKTKKKRILPSFKPKSSYKVRVILLKKQVTKTHHAEVTLATVDVTKSLEASELAEEQVNQPSTAEAKKITHDSDESTDVQGDSDYESMLEDDMRFVLEVKAADSDDEQGNDMFYSDHIFQDDNAFVELSAEIKSSLPALVTTVLNEQLPGFLSGTLKECFPSIIKESLQTHITTISEQFAAKQTKLNKKVVKHLNKQFNIFHVAQSDIFAFLETKLSKTLKSDMGQSVTSLVQSGMQEVKDDLNSLAKNLKTFYKDVQGMQTQLNEIHSLLELAVIIDDTVEGEKNKKDKDANPAAT
nr:hypothetical protein [Tanacetum cinerariifolium]